jgi:hypothetical protein
MHTRIDQVSKHTQRHNITTASLILDLKGEEAKKATQEREVQRKMRLGPTPTTAASHAGAGSAVTTPTAARTWGTATFSAAATAAGGGNSHWRAVQINRKLQNGSLQFCVKSEVLRMTPLEGNLVNIQKRPALPVDVIVHVLENVSGKNPSERDIDFDV